MEAAALTHKNFVYQARDYLLSGQSPEDRARLQRDRERRMQHLATIFEQEPSTLGDILSLTREARKYAGNVRKFDIYENNLMLGENWIKHGDFPHPVPDRLKDLSRKLDEIADATRSEYMKMITGMAKAIVEDFR